MREGNPLAPNTGGTEEPTPAQVPTLPKREGDEFVRTLGLDLTGTGVKTIEQAEVVKRGKLRLTNGYPVKFDLLARLLTLISKDDQCKISSRDLASLMGVADNHMRFLGQITHALGLTQAITYKPTPLGKLVAAQDTFFDDIGTLWFLHYIISSNPNFIVWNRFANVIMPRQCVFTLTDFRASFYDIRLLFAASSYERYLTSETRAVLITYTNQQFAKLAYLRQTDEGYSLGYRQPVPLLVLAASISRFRDQHQAGNTAVSVRDLLTAPNSPGVVFQMHEDTLRAGLEQLKHGHGFSLEARADLDQLRFAEDIPEHVFMERYYASR